jgi:hypothetical protein
VHAYGVDTEAVFSGIVDQRMDYYVLSKEIDSILKVDIRENFKLIKSFPDGLDLYQRITE